MPAAYLHVLQFTYLLTDQPDHLAFRVLTVSQELHKIRAQLILIVLIKVPTFGTRMFIAYHFPQERQDGPSDSFTSGIIFPGDESRMNLPLMRLKMPTSHKLNGADRRFSRAVSHPLIFFFSLFLFFSFFFFLPFAFEMNQACAHKNICT